MNPNLDITPIIAMMVMRVFESIYHITSAPDESALVPILFITAAAELVAGDSGIEGRCDGGLSQRVEAVTLILPVFEAAGSCTEITISCGGTRATVVIDVGDVGTRWVVEKRIRVTLVRGGQPPIGGGSRAAAETSRVLASRGVRRVGEGRV